jgi:hypothetical protein
MATIFQQGLISFHDYDMKRYDLDVGENIHEYIL